MFTQAKRFGLMCSGTHVQVWISPEGGLASDYVHAVQSLTANPEAVIVALLAIFALFHSGLAYLRPKGGVPPEARRWGVANWADASARPERCSMLAHTEHAYP
jgi:hypothetical protein